MKRTPTQILARAALPAAVLALLAVPVFASGDVATAIEGTWTAAQSHFGGLILRENCHFVHGLPETRTV